MNFSGSWQPVGAACRQLEKLVLPSVFNTSQKNLQSYPTTVLDEKCDNVGDRNILQDLAYLLT